jgi:hypothetical protein
MEKKKNFNPFTRHPNDVEMTYFQHMRFALMLARRNFLSSLASIIHAVFPFMFTTYASRTIAELHEIFEKRFKKK